MSNSSPAALTASFSTTVNPKSKNPRPSVSLRSVCALAAVEKLAVPYAPWTWAVRRTGTPQKAGAHPCRTQSFLNVVCLSLLPRLS